MNFFESLSPAEIDTVKRSLRATVEGSFFPDWEFETLIGVDRGTVKSVQEAFPRRTVAPDEFFCAVFGSMRNLLGYPHGQDLELIEYVPEGLSAIRSALDSLNNLAT